MYKKISLVVLSCLLLAAGQSFGFNEGLWHMDENSGTAAAEASGNHGAFTSVSGEYSWTTPGYNAAGAAVQTTDPCNNSYLSASLSGGGITTNYLEMEAWLKPTGRADDGTQVLTIDGAGGIQLGPRNGQPTINDATIRMLVLANGSEWIESGVSATPLFDGNWHKVTGIFDSTGAVTFLQVLFDDVDQGKAFYGAGKTAAIGSTAYIGANAWDPSFASQRYIGAIDEVRIIPEPATLSLLALGGLLLRRRKA